jgi:asparagine synthase (glutamine-hydrolysing)
MCGITGYFGRGNAPSPAVLDAMMDSIAHRGPDGSGAWTEQTASGTVVGFGHRRLSIVDLEGGKQPLSDEHGDRTVCFNGEIYNHEQLRAELLAAGHQFRTRSDTEVLVHGLEEWGEGLFPRLRGMFAFALWDRSTETLWLARDPLGEKPLYLATHQGLTYFASEAKALFAAGVPAMPEMGEVRQFLTFRYVPGPATGFAGVAEVPPGTFVRWQAGTSTSRRYWDLHFPSATAERSTRPAGLVSELRRRLDEAVQMRMMADVPVGALLSGGVDSSAVVALMRRHTNQQVSTFSVGFEQADGPHSELPYARMVARHLDTDHHEVVVQYADFERELDKLAWHFDDPVADPAAIPTLLVCRLARQHVKVVLTGEGADELFAGYPKYGWDRFSKAGRWLPRRTGRWLSSAIRTVRPDVADKVLRYWPLLAERDELTRWSGWFGVLTADEAEALWRGPSAPEAPRQVLGALLGGDRIEDSLHRMLKIDTMGWLVDDLLAKCDKMSMACSLEVRPPFLDPPLVEWAAKLPPGVKVHGLERKHIFKEAVRDLIPEAILRRPKLGFPVPLAAWMRGPMLPRLRSELLGETPLRPWIDERLTANWLDDHAAGRADRHRELWMLLVLSLWYRQFFATNADAA